MSPTNISVGFGAANAPCARGCRTWAKGPPSDIAVLHLTPCPPKEFSKRKDDFDNQRICTFLHGDVHWL
jgi:hypothetical protein